MSLNSRLLLSLIGIPLLIYAAMAVLMVIHTHDRALNELDSRLTDAMQLARPTLHEALLGVSSGQNESSLRALAYHFLDTTEAAAVHILDAHGTPVIRLGAHLDTALLAGDDDAYLSIQGERGRPEQRQIRQGNDWYLSLPLLSVAASSAPGTGASVPALPTDSVPGRETPLAAVADGWFQVRFDTSALMLERYRLMAVLCLGGLLLGSTLFITAYLVSRRITRPLEEAGQALDRLARNDFSFQLPLPESDEPRRVVASINTLAVKMQRAQQDMQAQVEQATQELQESMETIEEQNIALDLARREAVTANATKTRFLANVSHEIRTPLNGIIGFCRLLKRSTLETRQQEWLNQVHRACDNLLMLVNDILDFSRLEADSIRLEDADLDLTNLIDSVLGLNAPEAQRKQLELVALIYEDVPVCIRGDALRLTQVLNNLIGNALKFTDQGEVVIRVMLDDMPADEVTSYSGLEPTLDATPDQAGGEALWISISDTGIGLDDAQQRQMFKAFTQAEISHSRQLGGSGLGLSICKQLVKRMGGRIQVDSQRGEGSVFSFWLPLTPCTSTTPSSVTATEPCFLGGAQVAISETHTPTRWMLEHLVERWGGLACAPDITKPDICLIGLVSQPLDTACFDALQQRLDRLTCPAVVLVNTCPLEAPSLNFRHGGELLCKPVIRHSLAEALARQSRRCQRAEDTRLIADSGPVGSPADKTAAPGARVLVVDDNDANRHLLEALVTGEQAPNQDAPGGCLEVLSADSGEQALTLAASLEHPVDLVLMDIRMPGLDGIETADRLRRLTPSWASCPMVAVTAHALPHERKQWLAQGMSHVLVKPIDVDELAQLLHRYLGISQATGKPSTPSGASVSADHRPPASKGLPELAVIDMELGAKMAGNDRQMALRMLKALVDHLDDYQANLEAAHKQHAQAALLEQVHHLNGATRYGGVPEVALLVETLETRLRTGDNADALIDQLFEAFDRLRQAYREGSGVAFEYDESKRV